MMSELEVYSSENERIYVRQPEQDGIDHVAQFQLERASGRLKLTNDYLAAMVFVPPETAQALRTIKHAAPDARLGLRQVFIGSRVVPIERLSEIDNGGDLEVIAWSPSTPETPIVVGEFFVVHSKGQCGLVLPSKEGRDERGEKPFVTNPLSRVQGNALGRVHAAMTA